MSDDKFTKNFWAAVHALQGIGESGEQHGLLGPNEGKRLTVETRAAINKQLVDSGMSLRDAGKVTGVGKSTVQEDVSGKRTKSSGKRTAKKNGECDAHSEKFESDVPEDEFEAAAATNSVRDLLTKPPRSVDPEDERKQQRWAATSNLIDGILLFDRHKPGDGFEMAAAFDPEVAAMRREKITPARIREAIAFLEEVATAMEELNAQVA